MSWLSPKRRRTTGNLKAIPNGQVVNNGNGGVAPATPGSPPAPGSPVSEKAPTMRRPTSQPSMIAANVGGDGNLFYAYARKGDDLQSRYLLTFASASVANEWWLLLQTHFPDASRPGPQLFSFKTDDLLVKAWKHPSFAHLRSKWMYISFSDTSTDGLGGAAQGIIPVQDAQGHMLGGSAGSTAELEMGLKMEAKEVKNDVHRLEEHFERMMEAMERNTQKVAELADSRTTRPSGDTTREIDGDSTASAGSTIDMGVLSGHFVRMNDILSKNSQHIEQLAKKHYDNELKLRKTMDALMEKQRTDYLDMQQLTSHLDRIQRMMESATKERKDSTRDVVSEQAPQMDFSPLAERLHKVQEAVEQNSALMKDMLEDQRSGTGQTQPDLEPLARHLEKINAAVEQQIEHTKALVNFTGGGSERGAEEFSLAPVSAHLEQIHNAIEGGNQQAKDHQQKSESSLAPLSQRLGQIHTAIEDANKRATDHQQKSDIGILEKHLEALRRNSAKHNDHMQQLVESQNAVKEAVEANGGEIDFTPMTEYLDAIKESNEQNAENVRQLLDSQTRDGNLSVDFSPLTSHLEAIRTATEQNSGHILSLTESQQASAAKSASSPAMDWTPLTDRLNRIHSTLQKQAETSRDKSPGTGDSKFLMNALTSHLSKIQGITEQNATHVKSLREKQSSSYDKMHVAVSETSEQVRSLIARNTENEARHTENEARIEAQHSQMRELMSGQREMVEVMRQLAKSVVAQNKGTCDHVVVPPPRKMGRKVVGFVYDAKEGTP